jgi:uncharacterized protein YxeA
MKKTLVILLAIIFIVFNIYIILKKYEENSKSFYDNKELICKTPYSGDEFKISIDDGFELSENMFYEKFFVKEEQSFGLLNCNLNK